MKERPMLMNTEIVRAVLDGRKTQTRRVCVDQTAMSYQQVEDIQVFPTPKGEMYSGWAKDCGQSFLIPTKCPYGQVGDRLWVREKWTPLYEYLNPNRGIIGACFRWRGGGRVFKEQCGHVDDTYNFKPSIHMPRWASQITLEITAIRVERVQDIKQTDIIAEGLTCLKDCRADAGPYNYKNRLVAKWKDLWDSINAKPKPVYKTFDDKKIIDHYVSYPLDDSGKPAKMKQWYGHPHYCTSNPWVWVVEFKRIENEGQNGCNI